VTVASYLLFLQTFEALELASRGQFERQISKYDGGVVKIIETEKSIEKMQ